MIDLRTELEKLCRDWHAEIDTDYSGRDDVTVLLRTVMLSMVRQVEARLTVTPAQSPAAREALASASVSTVNDGENQIDQPTGRA